VKLLIAGDWHSDLHEEELSRSFRRLGHDVIEFKWFHYFTDASQHAGLLSGLLQRIQNKFVIGKVIDLINQDLLTLALAQKPDAIFIYRGTHITAATLRNIRQQLPGCVLVGYNNDDPFSPTQPRYLWRHFMAAIPDYDLMLAYRHANLPEFMQAGARRVELLRSWYVPDRSHPVTLTSEEQTMFKTDVVFIGHYEPDQRMDYLEAIVTHGHQLRLFGPTKYWKKPLAHSTVLQHLAPTSMVWREDYNRALCGARIALCFFSKLNRDTYTRRCFEIPATRTLMLSEYSEDLASLYLEGVEADYFRSREEMLAKIDYYINNPDKASQVAEAGYRKVISAGHDIDSRAAMLMNWIKEETGKHHASIF